MKKSKIEKYGDMLRRMTLCGYTPEQIVINAKDEDGRIIFKHKDEVAGFIRKKRDEWMRERLTRRDIMLNYQMYSKYASDVLARLEEEHSSFMHIMMKERGYDLHKTVMLLNQMIVDAERIAHNKFKAGIATFKLLEEHVGSDTKILDYEQLNSEGGMALNQDDDQYGEDQ